MIAPRKKASQASGRRIHTTKSNEGISRFPTTIRHSAGQLLA